MSNFVEAIEIELKKKTPEELSKTIIEQATRIIVLEKTIEKAIEYIENENYKEENICIVNGVKILDILRGKDEK